MARGYEDKEEDRVFSDSPVTSPATQRLILALLAEKQWISNSLDFKTAFRKVSPSLVTFLSGRRLNLSAAMRFGV
jgi:hypothetical protein